MLRSLVGSEMCIRDRLSHSWRAFLHFVPVSCFSLCGSQVAWPARALPTFQAGGRFKRRRGFIGHIGDRQPNADALITYLWRLLENTPTTTPLDVGLSRASTSHQATVPCPFRADLNILAFLYAHPSEPLPPSSTRRLEPAVPSTWTSACHQCRKPIPTTPKTR